MDSANSMASILVRVTSYRTGATRHALPPRPVAGSSRPSFSAKRSGFHPPSAGFGPDSTHLSAPQRPIVPIPPTFPVRRHQRARTRSPHRSYAELGQPDGHGLRRQRLPDGLAAARRPRATAGNVQQPARGPAWLRAVQPRQNPHMPHDLPVPAMTIAFLAGARVGTRAYSEPAGAPGRTMVDSAVECPTQSTGATPCSFLRRLNRRGRASAKTRLMAHPCSPRPGPVASRHVRGRVQPRAPGRLRPARGAVRLVGPARDLQLDRCVTGAPPVSSARWPDPGNRRIGHERQLLQVSRRSL